MKINRRRSREAALQVLFCQAFTDSSLGSATAGVHLTQTIEAFAEARRALDSVIAAAEAARKALDGAVSRLTKLSEKANPKITDQDDSILSTRLFLSTSQQDAHTVLRNAAKALEDADALFDEKGFAVKLLRAFEKNRNEVESVLDRTLEGWSLRRLTAQDGALLRLGVTELLLFHEVPPAVVINEYLELAKLYTNDEALTLLNGVLDRVAKQFPRSAAPAGGESAPPPRKP